MSFDMKELKQRKYDQSSDVHICLINVYWKAKTHQQMQLISHYLHTIAKITFPFFFSFQIVLLINLCRLNTVKEPLSIPSPRGSKLGYIMRVITLARRDGVVARLAKAMPLQQWPTSAWFILLLPLLVSNQRFPFLFL